MKNAKASKRPTVAGHGTLCGDADGTGGPTGTARFGNFTEIAYDARTNSVWVADKPNGKVKVVQLPSGQTATVLNQAVDFLAADGSGNLYASQGSTVVLLTLNGPVTLAGADGTGVADGTGCVAQFSAINGMVADPAGHRVWLTDMGANAIRSLSH